MADRAPLSFKTRGGGGGGGGWGVSHTRTGPGRPPRELQHVYNSMRKSRNLSTLSKCTIASSPVKGAVVDEEGAAYIPTVSILAVQLLIAMTPFGPHHLTYGTSFFPGA